jgi:hypothetical protein
MAGSHHAARQGLAFLSALAEDERARILARANGGRRRENAAAIDRCTTDFSSIFIGACPKRASQRVATNC